jgi:hypothetical protein
MNDTYTPLYLVVQTNKWLHLDTSLKPISNEFGYDSEEPFNEYTKSILILPIILFALGLLSIILVSSFRTSVICCSGKTQSKTPISYQNLIKILIIGVFFTLIFNTAVFIGSHHFDEGAFTVDKGVGLLVTRFDNHRNNGYALEKQGNVFNSNYQNATSTCAGMNSQSARIIASLEAYDELVTQYIFASESVAEAAEGLQDNVDNMKLAKECTVWTIYVAVLSMLFAFTKCIRDQRKASMQSSIPLGESLDFVIMFFALLEMIMVMFFADFCMDPKNNMMKFFEEGTLTYQTVEYYSTCEGENPYQAAILAMRVVVGQLDDSTQTGGAACPNDDNVDGMETQVTNMYATIDLAEEGIACEPVRAELETILEEGLCVGIFRGLYTFWLGNNLTAPLLFFTVGAMSIIYYYFGLFWGKDLTEDMRKTDDIYML